MGHAKAMYLRTLLRWWRGGLKASTLPLPAAISLANGSGELSLLPDALPDTHLLRLDVAHGLPGLDAIAALADRVAGTLNGQAVEVAVRQGVVEGKRLCLPLFALEGTLTPGRLPLVSLHLENI